MLTLGSGTYEANLQLLRKVYATLHNVGKRHELECQEMRTKQEAVDVGLRCIEVRSVVVFGCRDVPDAWPAIGTERDCGCKRTSPAPSGRHGKGILKRYGLIEMEWLTKVLVLRQGAAWSAVRGHG